MCEHISKLIHYRFTIYKHAYILVKNILFPSGSIFESDLISSYPIYNNELPCFIDPDNQEVTISYHEFGMFYDYNKVHLFAHCADVLQRLDLLPEEQAVLYAYMVLTAGSCRSTTIIVKPL